MVGPTRVRAMRMVIAVAWLISPCMGAAGDSFSFVVIADPHVSSGGSPASERLAQVVDWVNGNREREDIDLAFVIGDIGWGDGLAVAKSTLDGLAVPYAPLIGDNEVVSYNEAAFNSTFEPVYQSLASLAQDPSSGLSGWQKAPTPVWNPVYERWSHLQNFAFDYRGVHFACLDWCPRDLTSSVVEDAGLNDYPGGTLPWFKDYIADCSKDKLENIVMLAHHPMFTLGGPTGELIATWAAFAPAEFEQISSFLEDPNHDYGDYVSAAYAGHYHSRGFQSQDADPNRVIVPLPDGYELDPNAYGPGGPLQFLPLPGYDLYVVDDTHEDPPTLELVTVTEGETGFSYESRGIIVPEPSTMALLLAATLARRRRGRALS